jgi:DNA-binding transcriptional ArsR family regulator
LLVDWLTYTAGSKKRQPAWGRYKLDERVTKWLHNRMDVFDAIGDPSRRAILLLLQSRPMTAGAIAEAFPTSRPAISRHLRRLLEAGLVSTTAHGREREYRLVPGQLDLVRDWLRRFEAPLTESMLDAFETEVYRTRRDVRAQDGVTNAAKRESA